MSKAIDNMEAALKVRMTDYSHLAGFPTLAKVLTEAGVRTIEWTLPGSQSIYITELGPIVQQVTPLASGLFDIADFDEDAILVAIRNEGAGEATLMEFHLALWRAGVVRYVVDLPARTVTYFGWDGSTCVDEFPDVDLTK